MTTTIPNMPTQKGRAAAGTDPRGILTFDAPLPPPLENRENSTQNADFTRRLYHPRGFTREATQIERDLLSHLGFELPDGLETVVSFPSRSTRRRRWPVLETPQEVPAP